MRAHSRMRSLVCVVMSGVMTGCAHAPEVAVANHEAVDVGGEHPVLNGAASICTERDLICILAGFAILGGTIAAIKSADD
jgi:hypothetical protein